MAETTASSKLITVEVVFALPEQQVVQTVQLLPGATAATAVQLSGLPPRFPDFNFTAATLGVWNKQVAADHVLTDGDRVEIYRPLPMDPREARRILAAAGKGMGKAAGAS
jgi:putative ubiquitin-RnfH superfamily antitoxin RatB of RatAB toxin-antitoxin module